MIQAENEAASNYCSVLMADDDRDLCTALRDVLEAKRHRVQIVHSGREALAACSLRSYDLLLLDRHLPDTSGVDLIPQVEQLLPGLDILITGNPSYNNAVGAVCRSKIGYLAKPLDFDRLVAIHDRIAQRKRLARENRRLQEAVRRAAAEREALIQQLDEKNAELERYTYTVSHDLRGPLTTITGFAELVQRDAIASDKERMNSYLGHITKAAKQMGYLLDEHLDLSRAGRVEAAQDVPLAAVVQEAVALVSGTLGERATDVRIAADLPAVRCDRLRLVEVFLNLLQNAVKFMGDQPQPRIEIGVRPGENVGDGGETVCTVRDNGIGIEPRDQNRVFRLFEQLDASHSGSGNGLAFVKRIIEAHGGRVWVESEGLGKGSCICFTLTPDDDAPLPGPRAEPHRIAETCRTPVAPDLLAGALVSRAC